MDLFYSTFEYTQNVLTTMREDLEEKTIWVSLLALLTSQKTFLAALLEKKPTKIRVSKA